MSSPLTCQSIIYCYLDYLGLKPFRLKNCSSKHCVHLSVEVSIARDKTMTSSEAKLFNDIISIAEGSVKHRPE